MRSQRNHFNRKYEENAGKRLRHTLQAASYFAPYGVHAASESYFTSDYDLSKFHSHFFGGNLRIGPPNGILGIQHLSSVKLRVGHYVRSEGLSSNMVSLHLMFK